MRISLVVHVFGLLLRFFGLMFLAPLASRWSTANTTTRIGFAVSAVVTVASGS